MLLVLLLLVSTFTVGVAAIADRDKLVTRAVQVLLRQGSSALENSRALPPIMSDGSFAGIDYNDANISDWAPLRHLEHLVQYGKRSHTDPSRRERSSYQLFIEAYRNRQPVVKGVKNFYKGEVVAFQKPHFERKTSIGRTS